MDESERSAVPRVRNYVRTGEGPNDWMVITMAERDADVLERLGGRCDSCGANVAITPDTPAPFVLLSGKICCRDCVVKLGLPDLPGSGDFSA
jgi:hypothetical protein